jgi:membrane protein required for colicin V production
MSSFDIGLIIFLAIFVISGLFKGIIKMIGAIFGFFAGTYIASHYYLAFYGRISGFISGKENVLKIASFIFLFILTAKLVALVFWLIEKVFKFAAFIPGSKFINNLLGAAFGFIQGAMILGLMIYLFSRYLNLGGTIANLLLSSHIAPFLLKIGSIATPLLPEAFKSLMSLL